MLSMGLTTNTECFSLCDIMVPSFQRADEDGDGFIAEWEWIAISIWRIRICEYNDMRASGAGDVYECERQ